MPERFHGRGEIRELHHHLPHFVAVINIGILIVWYALQKLVGRLHQPRWPESLLRNKLHGQPYLSDNCANAETLRSEFVAALVFLKGCPNVLDIVSTSRPAPIYFCERPSRLLVQLAVRKAPRDFSLHAGCVNWLLCCCCGCCLQCGVVAAAAAAGSWCLNIACCYEKLFGALLY